MSQTIPGTEPLQQDEKATLVERAKDLKIKNAHTMSVTTLKKKIAAKLAGEKEEVQSLEEAVVVQESAHQKRMRAAREARKLIRVMCQNMNPSKNHKTHDLLKVANRVVGTIHRAVPTSSPDDGTHVEQMILDTMKEQQYLAKTPYKHPKTGEMLTKTEWKQEWKIVELPPLTQRELDELAKKQQVRDSAL